MKTEALYLFELPKPCRVDDCEREIVNKRERLCDPHYKRWWRHGDPEAGGPVRPRRIAAAKKVEVFEDGTRRCTNCDERLPATAFHKDANATGGLRSHCAECHKAKAREWYAANRERQAQREKDRRAADPERYRRWDMERYARDREKRIALATEHSHRRRLRLAQGDYDPTVTRSNLRHQYGDRCFYCEILLDFKRYPRSGKPGNLATIEHIVPISAGGGHTWDNVVLACLDCNFRKNAKSMDVWLGDQVSA